MRLINCQLLFLLFLTSEVLFSQDSNSTVKPSIIINEVAVVPLKDTHPKWIELRNVNNETVDLSGWSLHDSKQCLYTFKDGEKLASGALLLVLFYESKSHENDKRDFKFERSIPAGVKKIIVFNIKAFDGRNEFRVKRETLEQESKGEPWWTNMIDETHPENKGLLTPSQFADLEKRAKKYLVNNSLPDRYLPGVMLYLSYFHYSTDEIALLGKNESLSSYIYWGSTGTEKETNLKFESDAIDKGLIQKRSTFTGFPFSNAITMPQIIFERSEDRISKYLRVAKGSPGLFQKKEIHRDYLSKTKIDRWSLQAPLYDSNYPSWYFVEFSNFKNFSEISFLQTVKITRLTESAHIQLDPDFFRMGLASDKTYYRVKRILCTGEETDWIICEKPIDWPAICRQFKVDSPLGLINLWHKNHQEQAQATR